MDLGCFLVSARSSGWVWRSLRYPSRPLTLLDLEKKHGQIARRKKFFEDCIGKALESGRPFYGEYLGFGDWFVPIRRGSRFRDLLQSGNFAFREANAQSLALSWKELTGRKAVSTDPEYHEFVRVALEIPVLEGHALGAYRQSLEMLAEIFTGPYEPLKARHFFQQLLRKSFSKLFPHSCFLDWVCGRPTFPFALPWVREIGHYQWIKEEIGINRIPTTVIVMAPRRVSSQPVDPVEEMLTAYRLRRKAFQAGQSVPETVGGRLGDYGALFVTSVDPKWSRRRHRLYLEKIARELQKFLEKNMGIPMSVGVGGTAPSGSSLQESHRQANLALYWGQTEGQETAFFDFKKEEAEHTLFRSRPEEILRELCRILGYSNWFNVEVLRDRFVAQVIYQSSQNPQVVRLHFRYGLMQLVETLCEREGGGLPKSDDWFSALGLSLDSAGTIPELIEIFRKELERFRQYLLKPSLASHDLNLEKVRVYIDENFQHPLRIQTLAKMAGLSSATFSRSFPRVTGKGFEVYLQEKRMEKATRLLRFGTLPVTQVARECGFKSISHFIKLFRRHHDTTPAKYRRQFASGHSALHP